MIHVICTFLRFVACLELSNDATFCWTFVDRSLREPNGVKRCKMKIFCGSMVYTVNNIKWKRKYFKTSADLIDFVNNAMVIHKNISGNVTGRKVRGHYLPTSLKTTVYYQFFAFQLRNIFEVDTLGSIFFWSCLWYMCSSRDRRNLLHL